MPTKTFYNLPMAKREKLMDAVRQELTRVPFEEVSINKIVHTAGISRGSFYQYFSGKEDMLEYLLSDYRKLLQTAIQKSLRKNRGDLFSMFHDLLNHMVEFTTRSENRTLLYHLFSNSAVSARLYSRPPNELRNEQMETFLEQIDLSLLDIREESDFADMLDLLFLLCRETAVDIFDGLRDPEIVRQEFEKRLALLQRGFSKQK